MSDSDSDTSSASQQLNEVADSSQSPTLIKPVIESEEATFTHKGIQWRSIGVLCTPELSAKAIKEAEAKVIKVNHFATLPDPVVKHILDWTITIATEKAEKAIQETDWTDCGKISSSKLNLVNSARYTRHDLFRRLMRVSRRFYHFLLPEFWRKLDMSAFSRNSYAHASMAALALILAKSSTILQRTTPASTTANQNGSSSTSTSTSVSTSKTADTTIAGGSTAGGSPPPKKKRKRSTTSKLATTDEPSLPTFGELVETIVIGSCTQNLTYFVDSYLQSLPNLQHVFLPPKTNISLHYLQNFALKATYTLRTLDHLFLADNGEDNDSRAEAILSLFNAAPNLERFGVTGKFILDELRGKRLAFVWKLNARFKHSPTGCLGVGLKQLYFGKGVEMTVGFLRTLKESCPRLTKLHILAGVKVTIDATPQGGTPFDLAAFATQWSSLTAFTLIGTDTFNTAGTLDAILKVCPALSHLHIRADHITHNFFSTIVRELAIAPLPPAGPPTERLQTRQIGSETSASAALVEASKKYKKGVTGLKHPIQHLGITCRLSEAGDAGKASSLHIPGCNILPFSLLLLSFQSRGLEWPNEIGGQRDLLNRAALMINLEHKKQRDQAAREKEEEKKKKLAEVEKDKGKGKEKQVEVEVAKDEQAVPDIDITSSEA